MNCRRKGKSICDSKRSNPVAREIRTGIPKSISDNEHEEGKLKRRKGFVDINTPFKPLLSIHYKPAQFNPLTTSFPPSNYPNAFQIKHVLPNHHHLLPRPPRGPHYRGSLRPRSPPAGRLLHRRRQQVLRPRLHIADTHLPRSHLRQRKRVPGARSIWHWYPNCEL